MQSSAVLHMTGVFVARLVLRVFLAHPIYIIFALSPTRNSDPGSPSMLFSPLPTTLRGFIFIATRLQPLLPSSTRIEFTLEALTLT